MQGRSLYTDEVTACWKEMRYVNKMTRISQQECRGVLETDEVTACWKEMRYVNKMIKI